MANMNIVSPTAAKIYAAWLREGQSEPQRNYLGASIVGHECDAYLWIQFRNAVRESFDGRMYRLFDRGRREEAVFCDDLRRIGCEVKEFDKDGKQFSVSALGGHFGGHLDGVAKGLDEAPSKWHVVEFKTHSDSSFRKLCKEGVKKAKPMHYAQMQSYMGHTNLDCALYMAVNKDNDDLWCERVKFDKAAFDLIMARAKHVIETATPDRCATRRDDFRCKACPCASVCWHEAKQFVDPLVPVSCKTCCHASAETEGEGAKWKCKLGHQCDKGETECPDHLWLPFFVNAEPTDGDDYGILYSFDADGKPDEITIGKAGVPSREVQKFGPAHARSVMALLPLGGMKIDNSNTIALKFSDPKYSVLFEGEVKDLGNFIAKNPIADFARPLRNEKMNGTEWWEYLGEVMVSVKDGKAVVKAEKLPF